MIRFESRFFYVVFCGEKSGYYCFYLIQVYGGLVIYLILFSFFEVEVK